MCCLAYLAGFDKQSLIFSPWIYKRTDISETSFIVIFLLGVTYMQYIRHWTRAEIFKIKPNLEPSVCSGLPLGLLLDPIILIGSDLTNERDLSAKLSANQLIVLNLKIQKLKLHKCFISIECSL